MCTDHRTKAVGDVFNYVAAFHPDFSVWLLILYDEFAWAVTITMSETAATDNAILNYRLAGEAND